MGTNYDLTNNNYCDHSSLVGECKDWKGCECPCHSEEDYDGD